MHLVRDRMFKGVDMLLRWQSLLLVTTVTISIAACAPSRVQPEKENVRVVTVVPGMVYESNSEVARTETVIAMAEDAGAKQTAPQPLGAAYTHLERARVTYSFAEDEDEMEPEDELQIEALRHSQKALADAELALASAEAARDEARVAELQRSIQAMRAELRRLADAQAGNYPAAEEEQE